MKKTLLLTTALMAVGLIAGSAVAANYSTSRYNATTGYYSNPNTSDSSVQSGPENNDYISSSESNKYPNSTSKSRNSVTRYSDKPQTQSGPENDDQISSSESNKLYRSSSTGSYNSATGSYSGRSTAQSGPENDDYISSSDSSATMRNTMPEKTYSRTNAKSRSSMANATRDARLVKQPRMAAERFVQHVNYARVALAMKNPGLAKNHIAQADSMLGALKQANTEERRISRVESGRVVYQYNTDYKYHYYPIEAGPVEVKKVKSGPFWAKRGLAVTDAEIVYLTLDLTDDKADSYLSEAEMEINNNQLREADRTLASLIDDVVSVDERVALPLDKARDNIALARNFVLSGNYDGARYALRHADNALSDMEGDDNYAGRRNAIIAMRRDVNSLQNVIKRNDPSLMERADAQLTEWWRELKGWASSNY